MMLAQLTERGGLVDGYALTDRMAQPPSWPDCAKLVASTRESVDVGTSICFDMFWSSA